MRELEYPFDSKLIIRKKIKMLRMLKSDGLLRVKKNVAILGGSTTNDIKLCLELFLLNYGIEPIFYESDYNQYYQEALFPTKELVDFKPDCIYIFTTNRNITRYPSLTDSLESVEYLLNSEYEKYKTIWGSLSKTFKCPIIQNNFEKIHYRLLGNRDGYDKHGKTHFINCLNQKFAEYAQTHDDFYICDVDYISADFGLSYWHDMEYWYMYKYALSLEAIPVLSFNVANIIKSVFGKNKKGFVLDLDNTLWGGVVGDDGVDNIEIGLEEPIGQAFLEFQEYIKEHKNLGVVLNIDSKNDYENAVAGLNHPDGILKPNDFIIIKANWEQKDKNFIEISNLLSLLPESLVFIDDNPAERLIINEQIPGVCAPELGSVQDYIRVIDHAGYFESTIISSDDINRNQMYRENVEREQIKLKFNNYSDYLLNLNMKATIGPFEPSLMARISQLSNKSNQFNLTTRRYTQNEIEKISLNSQYIDICGRLEDRFGDNGLTSVVIGHQIGEDVNIDLWIMSCRVLKRCLEFAMMNEFVTICNRRKVKKINGFYYPTKKNSMVRDFYYLHGFKKVYEDIDGNTKWELITKDYEYKETPIIVNQQGE